MNYQKLISFDAYWVPTLGKTHAKEDALKMNDLIIHINSIYHPFNLIIY